MKIAPDTLQKLLENVSQEDTRWSIVYNPVDLSISFRTDMNRNLKTLNLEFFDYKSVEPLFVSISDTLLSDQDLSSHFELLHQDQNQALINTVFDKMVKLNEIDSKSAELLRQKFLYFNQISES